jgi:hypothetical protein
MSTPTPRPVLSALTAGGLGLLATGLVALPAPAQAATVTVKTESQLRAAVARANKAAGEDTIRLGRSITLRKGSLEITDALVLDGNGKQIRARGKDRILDVVTDVTLRVEDLTLRGGRAPEGESGGAIRATGATLEVVDSRLVGNRALGEGASGGAIMNDGGSVSVVGTRIERNRAERAGGGIEANAGVTTVTDSVLRGNRTGAAPGNGGALHLTGAGAVVVEGSRVLRNRASAEGGGLWNSADGQMSVTGTLVARNRATGRGRPGRRRALQRRRHDDRLRRAPRRQPGHRGGRLRGRPARRRRHRLGPGHHDEQEPVRACRRRPRDRGRHRRPG